MIKFENTRVVGWEAAIRGMRNPKNSWDRSDSFCVSDCNNCPDYNNCEGANDISYAPYRSNGYVGPNDLNLMKRLAAGGPVHAKYRRMIVVYVDITAPLYWWKEFDTYKVGTVANSCSTMHKITAKEFTLDDFSTDKLITRDDDWDDLTCEMVDGQVTLNSCAPSDILQLICNMMNFYRNLYLTEEHPDDKKIDWWQMIQLLPTSYNQKRTVMMNYEVLAGIYPMRKNHKLDEWQEFCRWIEQLPYSELITGDNEPTVNTKNITPLDCNSLNAIASLLNHNGFSNEAGILLNIQNKLEISKEFIDKFNAIGNINAISPADVKIGLDTASQPDFSSCMNPPIEGEIYIEDILTRADVMWYSDMINGSRVVKSRNTKEPLTEQEQECLKRMWRNQGFRGDVIFYVEEPNADNGKM